MSSRGESALVWWGQTGQVYTHLHNRTNAQLDLVSNLLLVTD